ncbi:MAG: Gfo/Idh/MocA family oxidoreductase [Candidatus Dormibacteraeota bacterium]|nr:Gfo/Idh/MocA family oxidoreductase [Candidatus Dormibacteraeota bacterium]
MTVDLRIGLIGTGFAAHLHARALLRIGHPIAVVAARDTDRAATFAAEYGVVSVADSWQGLVETPSLDLVVVAAPTQYHATMGIAALEAGRHVVCEKPLAVSLAAARQMVEAAKRSGLHLGYAEQETFAPNYRRVLELIEGGAVGDPVLVKHRGAHSGPHSPWFYGPEAGGGAIIDMGVHGIHLARSVYGGAMPTRVVAHGRTITHDTSLEDDALVVVDFGPERLAEIEASWIQQGGLYDHLEVYGRLGHAVARVSPNEGLRVYTQHGISDAAEKAIQTPGWTSVSADELNDLGYVGQAADYVGKITRDEPPTVTGVDGLIVMQVVDAAYRSIASGESISIGGVA